MAAITGSVVLSWTCQLRLFTRAAAARKRSLATLGSLMPAVERLRRMPLKPSDASRSNSASVALSSMTATPACVLAARRHAIDRRGIVGAVHAWRHDHHALDFERLVQCAHFFRQ